MTQTNNSVLAGRLIQWGLRPEARPLNELEYQELLTKYQREDSFRALVKAIADGLGLLILDDSDHGLVLAPQDESVFAFRPSEFRNTSSADDRLLDGLVQVAVATTVFPRARDLEEDPDLARPAVTIEEVDEQLRHLAEQLEKGTVGEPDPLAGDENKGLIEAWRVFKARLEVMETKSGRKAMRATRRIIERGLERLEELNCFVRRGPESAPRWQPTRRYQVLVQELAATSLYQTIQGALADTKEEAA